MLWSTSAVRTILFIAIASGLGELSAKLLIEVTPSCYRELFFLLWQILLLIALIPDWLRELLVI